MSTLTASRHRVESDPVDYGTYALDRAPADVLVSVVLVPYE